MVADTSPERPYYGLLGIRPVTSGDGRSEVLLAENPMLCNSRGHVHGGAIYSMLDVACASAARSVLPTGTGAATISLTVTYLQPGRGALTGYGTVLRAGRTVVAVEAEARDNDGVLVAKAHGTMRTIANRG